MNYQERKSIINSVNDGNSVNGDAPNGERPFDRNCDVCGEVYDYYLSSHNVLCTLCQEDKDRLEYMQEGTK